MYRKSILLLIFTLVFSMSMMVVASPEEATAAGVTMYGDLEEDAGAKAPSTVATRPEIASADIDDVFLSFISSANFAISDTVTFTFPAGWVASGDCVGTDTTDADGDSTVDGAFAAGSGTSLVYTFSAATTAGNGTGVEFCLRVTAPGIATNNAVIMTSAGTVEEFGGTLLYVEDANDVNVTARVDVTLLFEIRNGDDIGLENSCALGTLVSERVSTCEYRLHVETTASYGYTISIKTNGDLSRVGAGDQAVDGNAFDRVTDGVSTITNASAEYYGIAVGGTNTGNAANCTYNSAAGTEETGTYDYGDNDSPLPTEADGEEPFFSCNGPNVPTYAGDTTNTVLVEHRVIKDADTYTGNYSQLVTYYVIANF